MRKLAHTKGFTLIELSIVLVIIGLIVGGILTGQTLIGAAGVRAQITQIEKYNQAANAFFGKYGYLPGDIPAAPAAQFGFASRGTYPGEGDGNGFIQGISGNGPSNNGTSVGGGEAAMFWVDLSTATMIDGSFNTATSTSVPLSNVSQASVASYMPAAKIGRGNYVYVWSGYTVTNTGGSGGQNLFGLAGINGIYTPGWPNSYTALTVQEAYSIDSKIDDGLPVTGNVQAVFITANGGGDGAFYPTGVPGVYAARGLPTQGSSTTCFDNGNSSNPMAYSLEISNGSNLNCALSFMMKSGD